MSQNPNPSHQVQPTIDTAANGSELRSKIDEAVIGLWLTYRKAFNADPHILHVGDSELFESITFHPAIQSRLSK